LNSENEVIAIAVDGNELSLGGGLLAIVRPALDQLEPEGILAVLSRSLSVRQDLPSWCRAERHHYLGLETIAGGIDRHLIARGEFSMPLQLNNDRGRPVSRDGKLTAADVLLATPLPRIADPSTGFAPRGSRVEPGGPAYPFTLNERDHVAPPEVANLYDQAVGAQWDATSDIAWSKVKFLPESLENALAQVMTFLAENELSALYVPSRFMARIHPSYAEVAMFLATQLADEARHIDVFLKRARLCGRGLGISSVVTSRSLLSLLQVDDFAEATFLLSVLGEGTFLDLLSFIERHAPDEPTEDLVRRAKNDESRHVHFGLAHIRWGLANEPGLYHRLETSVRNRAAALHGVGGVPAPLQDALTILAAGGTEPRAVARGHESFRELLETMYLSRIKRLEHAGFTTDQAETISQLHTPNFM
jgi:TusA-related sulfurtransferase